MAEARFQHIPIPSWEIAESVTELGSEYAEVTRLLTVLYQLELHDHLELLERAYAPFNPELDWRESGHVREPDPSAAQDFAEGLSRVLERGNYERLDDADIAHAFAAESLFPIKVIVDTSVYADWLLYARGETVHTARVPRVYGFFKREITVPTFDRVCIYIRFKSAEELQLPPEELAKRPFEPGTAVLKLFRNIPKADLEMLFPNCRPTMRVVDKLLIGIPALLGGVPVLVRMAPAALALAILLGFSHGQVDFKALLTGLGGLAVLGSYLYRQWDKFKNRRILFGKVLTENLYFRNLGSNEGVLTRVVDEADDQECKEALLAYVFAHRARGWIGAVELDAAIESFLAERFEIELDFEIGDALAKLEELGLVEREGERIRARALDEAATRVRARIAEIAG
ncbi:MAG: TMEM143 family protein [Enhygromyxa sp.]